MIRIRKSEDRFRTKIDWLDSRHSFSFGDHYDPDHLGFRALRVVNEDWIAPGAGFPTHGHRDMEIVTIPLEGALEHRDSTGGQGQIRSGEVQRMTAGAGIRHSECNASATEPVHLLQIWIEPERRGLAPGYEQRALGSPAEGQTILAVSPDARDGSLKINQDAEIRVGRLAAGGQAEFPIASGRHAWLQLASGALSANGAPLRAGDAAALSDEPTLSLTASEPSLFVLFDLA